MAAEGLARGRCVHDFVIPEFGRAVPYGVGAIAGNAGWVSLGIDHDTAAFAANAIRSCRKLMGRERYPNDQSLLGHRRWRRQQRFAPATVEDRATKVGRRTQRSHHRVPRAARHRQVEQDRASPLLVHHRQLARQTARSHQVIVQLIAATTTKAGLKVCCELDQNTYPAGIKVSNAEMDAINLTRHDFHGERNYTVSPKALALEQ